MRSEFIRGITAAARRDSRIMLLTADLGFKLFDEFAAEFPGRFLNVGVAETNMIGVAAGLALGGMRPFAYSIAPFATLRCLEHIRNDVCYHKLPVTIVGLGAGYSYGHNGPSHHALEDIAVMRALANMTVVCPGDPVEVELAVAAASSYGAPLYLRIGRAGDPVVHEGAVNFQIGRAITMRDGHDCTLISTGNMLAVALGVSGLLGERSIRCRVLNLHTVKPLDETALRAASEETGALFTIEEHSRIGGLGSAVAEWCAASHVPGPLRFFGAEDCFAPSSGSQAYLRARCGLTAGQVADSIAAQITRSQRADR
jgi:transketolase